MRAVKSENTKPEVRVRQMLHRMGFRFRLHRKDLPGRPNIVLPGKRAVIFVHGCFWHQHKGCRAADRPSSNTDYWNAKLSRNTARDKKNLELLKEQGWRAFIVWECQMKNLEALGEALKEFLSSGKTKP